MLNFLCVKNLQDVVFKNLLLQFNRIKSFFSRLLTILYNKSFSSGAKINILLFFLWFNNIFFTKSFE